MRQKSENKKGYVRKRLLAVVLAAVLLPLTPLQPVKAAGATETVSIQVTYGQTQARALATQINELRTDINNKNAASEASGGADQAELPMLDYDYRLEQIAMKRAAEVALAYDNEYRPNSTGIATLYTSASVVENISVSIGKTLQKKTTRTDKIEIEDVHLLLLMK